jgi:hypothetical protein
MVDRLRVDGSLLATPAAVDDTRGVTLARLLSQRGGRGTERGSPTGARRNTTAGGTRHPRRRIRRRRGRRIAPSHSPLGPLEPLLDGPFSENEEEEHHQTENGNELGQHVPTRVAGLGDDLDLAHQGKQGDHDNDDEEEHEHARHAAGYRNTVALGGQRGARRAVDAGQRQHGRRESEHRPHRTTATESETESETESGTSRRYGRNRNRKRTKGQCSPNSPNSPGLP